MENIYNLIDAARNSDATTFKDLFAQEMASRINNRIDDIKLDMSQSFGINEDPDDDQYYDTDNDANDDQISEEEYFDDDELEEIDEDLEDDVTDQIDETHYGRKNVSTAEKEKILQSKAHRSPLVTNKKGDFVRKSSKTQTPGMIQYKVDRRKAKNTMSNAQKYRVIQRKLRKEEGR